MGFACFGVWFTAAVAFGMERMMNWLIVSKDQSCDEEFTPYRHLAIHVLARALRDLSNPGSPTDCESARRFLAGSPMLLHWCRVAALDPRLLTQHVARVYPG